MSFKIAIVGRSNVGKSSLFNRLIGEKLSITDDQPGVTRDRIYAQGTWLTKTFSLIDTGGIDIGDAPFLEHIRAQAQMAMDEADVILFVTDGRSGITDIDNTIAKQLYRSEKPVIVAVNKIDHVNMLSVIYEFYQLGFGEPIAISSHHGIGIGDLLNKIFEYYKEDEMRDLSDTISFSIVGRPNVGKSSLTNAILGEDRVIVSDISGTTRDAIDSYFVVNKQKYRVIDTAGIKKRGKIYENTDRYSLLRAVSAIERSEVCLLVLDGHEGIVELDKTVSGYIIDQKKAVVIVVNKWDIVTKDDKTMHKMIDKIKVEFPFLDYAPIVFLSALENERIHTLYDAINLSYENYNKKVKTSILNDLLQDAVAMNPTPNHQHGKAQFNYITQVASCPPSFAVFVNDPKHVHFSYVRYLNNFFRSRIDFSGTPIELFLRKKNEFL